MLPTTLNIAPRRTRTAVLVAIAALFFSGCDATGPEAALEQYHLRTARVLEVSAETVTPAAARATPLLPHTGAMRIELAPGNLGALDFLALRGCALQVTIGKRNSSLGIHASDSQRLLLELEFLELAPDCIVQMRSASKHSIADALQQAYALKQQQLPALIFNATLANREFRSFWHRPQTLGEYPANTSSLVISALTRMRAYIERWLSGDYRADNTDFEILLSEVAKGDGGALLLALAMQETQLAAINQTILLRQKRGPLCAPSFRSAAADTLPNVVRKFFVEAVQPWSAAVNQRRYQFMPAIEALETQLSTVLPATFQQWQELRDHTLNDMSKAPAAHVAVVSQILAPCNQVQ